MGSGPSIDGWFVRLGLILAALVGCGRATPPGALVGETEHFRLFVDPDANVPAGLDGMNGLMALETEWADVHTMLQMPDGKITYYWLSQGHIGAACGEADEGACLWEQSLEIDSPTLANPHELNHAYMYLREQRKPVPFLAEGIAEAIACGDDQPMYPPDVPWQGIVGQLESSSDQVYIQGGIFVRYLIRTYGIDAFLRYYEQSPEQRDPALFAANFQSFWGTTLDDAWTAIHVLPPGVVPAAAYETKICPCSLPPLDPAGPVTNDPARAPYWPLPNPAGGTLALYGGPSERVQIKDCAGVRPELIGQSVLARLDGTDRRYVLPPLQSATVDAYVADDCASAAPFVLSPLDNTGYLTVAVPNPADAATVYVNLASSFSGVLYGGLDEICGTCGFDQGACQPLAPTARPGVQGPLYGTVTLYRSVTVPTDVVSDEIDIENAGL
jgi:hypothetical protein